jgi:tetratricopeptide (TPR) repeat protein
MKGRTPQSGRGERPKPREFKLKPLASSAIPAALAKAEHYRLLNEPEEAESICIDVLEVEPKNQGALTVLLLARTDLLEGGDPKALELAREILPRLEGEYEQAYYGGLICERQAKTLLQRSGKRSGFVAYEWFQYALELYEDAIEARPSDTADATLRWNTCIRIIERHPRCVPAPEERAELGLE